MQIHDLIQGSPEWHAHRRQYRNASDSPVVMGESKYKTRSEFMHERHTGVTPEVDEYTNRRFDEGHRFEALARSLAEKLIGESLYPVTGTEGPYSASFDGLTMLDDIASEHKRLNDAIRAAQTVHDLDLMYHIQMEHQCLVSGAKKVLFMATNWDDEGNLLEEKHFWYEPNMELREEIGRAWDQFEKDEAAYVSVVHAEKPAPEVSIQLPALYVHAKGEITTSNMKEYGQALAAKLSEVRSIVLATDQDFSNAKEAAKLFREQCKKLELAKEAMLSQTVTIGEAARMMDAWHEDLRVTALKLEKDVEREDAAKKSSMIGEARKAFIAHGEALEADIRPIRLNIAMPNFAGDIKGKRSYANMQDAINTALANGKIAADATAKDIRAKLAWHKENARGYEFLFADLQSIIQKQMDDFQMLVQNRIGQHKLDEKKKLEAERERIQAEAQRKAEEAMRAQHVGAYQPAPEAPKPAETVKPVLVKSESKTEPAYSPALFHLAINELQFVRNKFAKIAELAGVMREIDLFLKSQEKTA